MEAGRVEEEERQSQRSVPNKKDNSESGAVFIVWYSRCALWLCRLLRSAPIPPHHTTTQKQNRQRRERYFVIVCRGVVGKSEA